ncbi:MAG: DUF411 domain-containing protein [Gemmatimonadota bacterium]
MSKKAAPSEQQAQLSGRNLTRRAWVGSALSVAAIGGVGMALKTGWRYRGQPQAPGSADASDIGTLTVYKSPTCQCCERWIKVVRDSGFTVSTEDRTDVTPIKREHGIPNALWSCHTTVADGYVFEGHVPPDLVQQVLRDRPAFAGLAVPGMPQSAPGMDNGHEQYEVKSFTRSGTTATYAVRI